MVEKEISGVSSVGFFVSRGLNMELNNLGVIVAGFSGVLIRSAIPAVLIGISNRSGVDYLLNF